MSRRNDNNASSEAPLLRLMRKSSLARKPAAKRRYAVAGLFAGIGGFELGLHRSGHETTLLCEIEQGAKAVLEARFPNVRLHDDVQTLKSLPRGTDLIVAGFPCQDLSQAGKTAGISGARSGLVGEVFRLLEQKKVPNVLLENVPFMLQLGRGRALEVIVGALKELGYRWAYRVVDSRSFGVPQRRERVYLFASKSVDPRDVILSEDTDEPTVTEDSRVRACGFYWTEGVRGLGWAVDAVPTLKGGSTIGIPSPPAILMPDGSVVKPDVRDGERMQGFEVDWTLPATTVTKPGHRWKLVGNAVTVDAAAWLGEQLAAPGSYDGSLDPVLPGDAAWPRAAWNMGDGRHRSFASRFPVRKKGPHLVDFLRYPTVPLSEKATAGFLSRTRTGSLRFPPGFIVAVEAHLENIRTRLSA